jgi:hypothetical protein
VTTDKRSKAREDSSMGGLLKTAAPVAGLALVVIGAAGLALGFLGACAPSARGGDVEPTVTAGPVAQTSIPPIGAKAMIEVETATFALG